MKVGTLRRARRIRHDGARDQRREHYGRDAEEDPRVATMEEEMTDLLAEWCVHGRWTCH